jgi:hypothetical protein
MKIGWMLSLGALAVAAVAVAAMPVQDGKHEGHGDGHGEHGGGDPMMEAYMKASQPGPQHAEFKESVGTWKATMKSWHAPGQPPSESVGTSRYELALGDRYLVEHYSGEMPDMGPFQGMGILAFNNMTGEYQHVWMDSFGTGIFVSAGKPDADGSCTMRGQMDDPMGGPAMPCRMIMKKVSDDERRFEMYGTQDGQETQMMEIVYTRAAKTR